MNIILVRSGTLYGPEYVELLKSQIAEFHPDQQVICLGDDAPLRMGYPKWWAKMELFAPWNAIFRPFLYLDLDTYVLGGIADILADEGDEFQAISDFYNPKGINSSVMIVQRNTNHIWDTWSEAPDKHMAWHKTGGDQDFLLPFVQRRLPYMGIKSYKADKLQESPGDARIVCFHGKPKPPDTTGWAGEIWDKYST